MACKNETCLTTYFVISVLLSATFLTLAFVVLPEIISGTIKEVSRKKFNVKKNCLQ